MTEWTKDDLIQIQGDHCQPLYYQNLAAFALALLERAENAEAERDRLNGELETLEDAFCELPYGPETLDAIRARERGGRG